MNLSRSIQGGLGLTITESGELAVRVLTCETKVDELELHAGTTEPVFEGSNDYVIKDAEVDENRDTVIPTGLTITDLPAGMQLVLHPSTTIGLIDPVSFTRSRIKLLESGQFVYGDMDDDEADNFNSHNSGSPLTFADSAAFEARFACNG